MGVSSASRPDHRVLLLDNDVLTHKFLSLLCLVINTPNQSSRHPFCSLQHLPRLPYLSLEITGLLIGDGIHAAPLHTLGLRLHFVSMYQFKLTTKRAHCDTRKIMLPGRGDTRLRRRHKEGTFFSSHVRFMLPAWLSRHGICQG